MKKTVARRRVANCDNVRYYNIQSFGLCNQLFAIGCALADGIHYRTDVCFRGFHPDMTMKTYIGIERLLNIEETNANLQGTTIVVKEETRYKKGEIFPSTEWQRQYQETCIRALVFSNEISSLARSLTPNDLYYCLHFRLDIDFVVFLSGYPTYRKWIQLTNQQREVDARKVAAEQVAKHKPLLQARILQYIDSAKKFFANQSASIVVLTAIGKSVMFNQNNLMEWAFEEFNAALQSRTIIRNTQFSSPGREYSAAVELNIACNEKCIGFIGSSGSSFSDTIRMRTDHSKYLCVV